MEIRVYTADLDFIGVIENETSLIWTRRYSKPGEFELYCPATEYNQTLLQMGNLVTYRGSNEAGVIEYLITEQSNLKNQITAKGRFLTSYMDRRIVVGTYTAEGKLIEEAMRELLQMVAAIPRVQLGSLIGDTETVTFQMSYKNLLEYEKKLSQASNIGFRFVPDFEEKTITFELYKGIDRSESQTDRNRVTFSEDYNNISEAKHTVNDQTYYNVCYVGASDNAVIEIAGDNTLTGLDRREMYVDGSSVNEDDFGSQTAYRAGLREYGGQTLGGYSETDSFECTTLANGNFVYKQDYDVGDIVTIKKRSWNLVKDMRITEIRETYEYGAMTVEPTFGDPLPETIDWEN